MYDVLELILGAVRFVLLADDCLEIFQARNQIADVVVLLLQIEQDAVDHGLQAMVAAALCLLVVAVGLFLLEYIFRQVEQELLQVLGFVLLLLVHVLDLADLAKCIKLLALVATIVNAHHRKLFVVLLRLVARRGLQILDLLNKPLLGHRTRFLHARFVPPKL